VTNKEQIQKRGLAILETEPHGLRYMEFVRRVGEALPNIPKNTIHGNLWHLVTQMPQLDLKPARGLYLHAKFGQSAVGPNDAQAPATKSKIKEDDFYESFADWLINELEECTKAIAVGGAKFKDKWGTPDVIGIREPRKSDIVKFPTEIVSAEIKLDTTELITAFGQACAYRLFSHKSYIVVPTTSPDEDIARLDTLARIFGIGLILFDATNQTEPAFDIRVRASNHEPDMFYVNRYMKLVEDQLFA